MYAKTVIHLNTFIMRTIYIWLGLFILMGACRGPEGLPGPRGPKGDKGNDGYDGELASVFEFDFDFTPANNHGVFFEFPIEIYDTDMTLAYLLWGYDDFGDPIWRLLPQSTIMEFGWLQYNYDFTQYDVNIFMEADFPLTLLGPDYTHDHTARVVVIPAMYATNAKMSVDFSDYNAVKEVYGLPELPTPEKPKWERSF